MHEMEWLFDLARSTESIPRVIQWQLIKSFDHTWLFDLSKDIGEQTNVAAENPETVQRLERASGKWLDEMAPAAWPSKPNRKIVDITVYLTSRIFSASRSGFSGVASSILNQSIGVFLWVGQIVSRVCIGMSQ